MPWLWSLVWLLWWFGLIVVVVGVFLVLVDVVVVITETEKAFETSPEYPLSFPELS